MERFVIRKNTLPYVHQWAVIDTVTNNKLGDYKTLKIAKNACKVFIDHGLGNSPTVKDTTKNNAYDAATERMNKPDGDQPPPIPKYSNKRRVELD